VVSEIEPIIMYGGLCVTYVHAAMRQRPKALLEYLHRAYHHAMDVWGRGDFALHRSQIRTNESTSKLQVFGFYFDDVNFASADVNLVARPYCKSYLRCLSILLTKLLL